MVYLILPKVKSRVVRYFYLSNNLVKSIELILNAPILVICKTIFYDVSSVAKVEIAEVFLNTKLALLIRYALEALGHPQLPRLIKSDNSMAIGFVNKNIYQKHLKFSDMQHYWLRDKETQKIKSVY